MTAPVATAIVQRAVDARHRRLLTNLPLADVRQKVLDRQCCPSITKDLQRLFQVLVPLILHARPNNLEMPPFVVKLIGAVGWFIPGHGNLVLVDALLVVYAVVVLAVVFIVRDGFQLPARFLRLLLSKPGLDVVEQAIIIINLNRGRVILVKIAKN